MINKIQINNIVKWKLKTSINNIIKILWKLKCSITQTKISIYNKITIQLIKLNS